MSCDVLPPPGSKDGGICPACGGPLVSVEVVGVTPDPEDEHVGPPDIAMPPPAETGALVLFARPAVDEPVAPRRPNRRPPAIPQDGLMIPLADNVKPLDLDPEWVAKKNAPPPVAPPKSDSGIWKIMAIAIVLAIAGITAYVLIHHH
jgi:hypothetical protein